VIHSKAKYSILTITILEESQLNSGCIFFKDLSRHNLGVLH